MTLRNRIVKAATFEGMSPRGQVTDALIDFHRAYAAGGAGLTTVAYCAVSMEGRGAPNEIVLRRESLPGLTRLADGRARRGCGRKRPDRPCRAGGPALRDPAEGALRVVGVEPARHALQRGRPRTTSRGITADFAAGALVLADAGFDAVELHMGHHYLINSFMSPRWNRRKDAWGGSVENRARLPAPGRAGRARRGRATGSR